MKRIVVLVATIESRERYKVIRHLENLEKCQAWGCIRKKMPLSNKFDVFRTSVILPSYEKLPNLITHHSDHQLTKSRRLDPFFKDGF